MKTLECISCGRKANEDILQLRAIEKWDGKLPAVTGSAVPFIDIESLSSK